MVSNSDLSRRDFVALMGAGAALTGMPVVARAQSSQSLYAYVGSWTQGPFGSGGGGGIGVFSVDTRDGSLAAVSRTGPEFDNMHAGYLCLSPDGRFLYANNEVKDINDDNGDGSGTGGVMSFAIDPDDGSLTYLNTQSSLGAYPAYNTIDTTGNIVLVSNHASSDAAVQVVDRDGSPEVVKIYDDSTIAIFPVGPEGALGAASDVAVLERTGSLDPTSERSPHAHSVNLDPSGRFALVCDKGADRVYVFGVDRQSGTFTSERYLAVESGTSPRHSAFHPSLPYVFINYEKAPNLSSLEFDPNTGEIEIIQTLSAVPSEFEGSGGGSDIRVHPNGRFVYACTRANSSIAVFSIEETSGRLTQIDIAPTLGRGPRNINFTPSGRFLFACNFGSDEVHTFEIDPDSGRLTPTGAVASALKPACIKLIEL